MTRRDFGQKLLTSLLVITSICLLGGGPAAVYSHPYSSSLPISEDKATRLASQHHLDDNVPLAYATFIGTHNSFNSEAYKYHNDTTAVYPFPNQTVSMEDQLEMGARILSLDIHNIDGTLRLCHQSGGNAGCRATDLSLTTGLNEIADWMTSHTDAIIVIDIEDVLLESANAHNAAITDIYNSRLGAYIYRPSDHHLANGNTCRFVPMQTLTKSMMRAEGRRVLLASSLPAECGNSGEGSYWRDWVWAAPATSFKADPFTDVLRLPHEWSIVYEDRAAGNAGTDQLSGSEITSALSKGAAIIGLDKFGGSGLDRHDESIWSWAANQPDNGGATAPQDCAVFVRATGKWKDVVCGSTVRAYACQNVNDGSWRFNITGQGGLSGAGPGHPNNEGIAACAAFGSDHVFAAPINAGLNASLKAELDLRPAIITEVWINASDETQEGLWVVQDFVPRQSKSIEETVIFDPSDGRTRSYIERTFNSSEKFRLFKIPADSTHDTLRLFLEGGSGGPAEMVCTTSLCENETRVTAHGGGGTIIIADFAIGTTEGEIAPGSEIGFIVGEAGTGLTATYPTASHGGGGGASAVLSFPPGSDQWQILAVAGGGGGASNYITWHVFEKEVEFSPSHGGTAQASDVYATDAGSGGDAKKGGGGGGRLRDGGGWDCPFSPIGGGKAGLRSGGDGGQSESTGLCSAQQTGGYGYGAGGASGESILGYGGGGGGGYQGGDGGGHRTGGKHGRSQVDGSHLIVHAIEGGGEVDLGQHGSISALLFRGNLAPAAKEDSYDAVYGQLLTIPAPGVLVNDSDPEDGSLTAVLDSDTSKGTLNLSGNGSFTYISNTCGLDRFTYHAHDGKYDSNTATVTIDLGCRFPEANPDTYHRELGETLGVPAPGVLGNDEENDGGPLTAVLDTPPDQGDLTLNADGSFTYIPSVCGNDQFSYHANNGKVDSPVTTVTINNDCDGTPPEVSDKSYQVGAGTTLTVPAPGVLDDVLDEDPVEARLIAGTGHGALSLNANGSFTYQPEVGYCGDTDSFTYIARDSRGTDSPVATVYIHVICVLAVNAGDDQVVTVGSLVSLNGSVPGYGTEDLDPFWEFTSEPALSGAVLDTANPWAPTFIADQPGVYVVSLRIEIDDEFSAPDTVQITAQFPVEIPVADAGEDRNAIVDDAITLSGSASYAGAEIEDANFLWDQVSVPVDSQATASGIIELLNDPNIATPSFTADVEGVYELSLIVTNPATGATSEADTVQITAQVPVVVPSPEAGGDLNVPEGSLVRLTGRVPGYDVDDFDPHWKFDAKPAGSAAALDGAAGWTPSFTADVEGIYVVSLKVALGEFFSDPDTVQISAQDPPLAHAGNDRNVTVRHPISLSGKASYAGVEIDTASYLWGVVSAPSDSQAMDDGIHAVLDIPFTATPTFTADVEGVYELSLIVIDESDLASLADTMVITASRTASIGKRYAYYKTIPGVEGEYYHDDFSGTDHSVHSAGLGVFSRGDLTDGAIGLGCIDNCSTGDVERPSEVVAIGGDGVTGAEPVQIIIDLEDLWMVDEVIIGTSVRDTNGQFGGAAPDDVEISFSDTGLEPGDFGAATTFPLWAITDNTLPNGHSEKTFEAKSALARYVKLSFDGQDTERYMLDEISVFGDRPIFSNGFEFGPPRQVFMSSGFYTGNLIEEAQSLGLDPENGLDAGDRICQMLADNAGIGGLHRFKAWLSDKTGSPSTRFSRTGGPYVRFGDLVRIADNFADLTDGSLDAPVDRTETGAYATGQGLWSATTGDGHLQNSNHCESWSAYIGDGQVGINDDYMDSGWTQKNEESCSDLWRLYCFEQ